MADVISTRKRSEVMSRIRSSGNKDTELALIQLFRKAGVETDRFSESLTSFFRKSGWRFSWMVVFGTVVRNIQGCLEVIKTTGARK